MNEMSLASKCTCTSVISGHECKENRKEHSSQGLTWPLRQIDVKIREND